jgi:hypothetical protein
VRRAEALEREVGQCLHRFAVGHVGRGPHDVESVVAEPLRRRSHRLFVDVG